MDNDTHDEVSGNSAPDPAQNKPAANSHKVHSDDDGIRLDRWFQRHYPHLGHSFVNKIVRTGQVRVDGKRVTGLTRLQSGQILRLPPAHLLSPPVDTVIIKKLSPLEARLRETLRTSILFSNQDFIVINKPAGLATQGGTGVRIAVDDLSPALVPDDAPKPRLVHRLDRDTSGILVLARSASAAAFLAARFQHQEIRKVYWALVIGQPKPARGTIRLSLTRVEGPFDKVRPDDAKGLTAITHYHIRAQSRDTIFSWLQLEPETGRMHQLRVHCAANGTPIVGDKKYGRALPHGTAAHLPDGLCLHARCIWLPLRNGKTKRVDAPLPATLQTFWSVQGWDCDDGS